jgi:hypothetical protein
MLGQRDGVSVNGLRGTEYRAQRAFERLVLTHVVALCAEDGAAPAEQVEQAIGFYRQTVADNQVQQLLGRRLRTALAALVAQGLLAPPPPSDRYRPTPAGRAAVARARHPWWRRAIAAARGPSTPSAPAP